MKTTIPSTSTNTRAYLSNGLSGGLAIATSASDFTMCYAGMQGLPWVSTLSSPYGLVLSSAMAFCTAIIELQVYFNTNEKGVKRLATTRRLAHVYMQQLILRNTHAIILQNHLSDWERFRQNYQALEKHRKAVMDTLHHLSQEEQEHKQQLCQRLNDIYSLQFLYEQKLWEILSHSHKNASTLETLYNRQHYKQLAFNLSCLFIIAPAMVADIVMMHNSFHQTLHALFGSHLHTPEALIIMVAIIVSLAWALAMYQTARALFEKNLGMDYVNNFYQAWKVADKKIRVQMFALQIVYWGLLTAVGMGIAGTYWGLMHTQILTPILDMPANAPDALAITLVSTAILLAILFAAIHMANALDGIHTSIIKKTNDPKEKNIPDNLSTAQALQAVLKSMRDKITTNVKAYFITHLHEKIQKTIGDKPDSLQIILYSALYSLLAFTQILYDFFIELALIVHCIGDGLCTDNAFFLHRFATALMSGAAEWIVDKSIIEGEDDDGHVHGNIANRAFCVLFSPLLLCNFLLVSLYRRITSVKNDTLKNSSAWHQTIGRLWTPEHTHHHDHHTDHQHCHSNNPTATTLLDDNHPLNDEKDSITIGTLFQRCENNTLTHEPPEINFLPKAH